MLDHSKVRGLGTMPRVLCLATLALAAGTVTVSAATWTIGDIVVCVGSGKCTTYPAAGTPTSIQVPKSPKKETGGVAWTGGFDAWVVDSRNQQLVLFSKTTQSVLKTIDTSLRSSGHPGPIVIDSAGSLYVGMYDASTILKYDSAGTWVATFATSSAPAWMDLADDHKTLWFTTAASPRELQRIDLTGATTPGPVALPIETGAAAGGFRLLPLASPFDGTGGFVLADAINIKRFGSSGAPQVYDVTGEDGWLTVTFEPNGTTFLAATAAGRIYRFALAGGAGALVVDTASTISGLSVKGGVQLNVRPLSFSAGTNVQREAVYGNPTATANDPFPRHSVGVTVATSPSAFTLLTSDNWAATDGVCQGTAATDYDCRTTQAFGTDPAPSPRCLPYVSSSAADCVFYRYEDEAATLPTGVTSADFITFIDYHEPGKRVSSPYAHPTCTANIANGNPRLLRDPDPTPGQYEGDITIGITRTSATDPIFGSGKGTSGSDYGAFDRCLADGVGGTTASFSKPAANSTNKFGSSIPFLMFVVDANGNDVTNAVDAPNNISLAIRHSSGRTFLAPQPTPGSSPVFFQKVTVKMGKTTRIGYAANLDTTPFLGSDGQRLLGNYVACATSINQGTGTTGGQPGQFAPVCIGFSLF